MSSLNYTMIQEPPCVKPFRVYDHSFQQKGHMFCLGKINARAIIADNLLYFKYFVGVKPGNAPQQN